MNKPGLEDAESTNIMNAVREARNPRTKAALYALARLTRSIEKLTYEVKMLTFWVMKEDQ